MSAHLQRLERLREHRRRRDRDLSVGEAVRRLRASAERAASRYGDFLDVWQQVIPAPLIEVSRVHAMRGGVVHVVVEDAAAAYELDRCLREGAEALIRRQYRGTLVRVRISIGRLEPARRAS